MLCSLGELRSNCALLKKFSVITQIHSHLNTHSYTHTYIPTQTHTHIITLCTLIIK